MDQAIKFQRINQFLHRFAYWLLLLGMIVISLIAFKGNNQLASWNKVEWHDVISEVFIGVVLLYWVTIIRRMKGGTKTFGYLYLGAASIIFLMTSKLFAEWITTPNHYLAAFEVSLTFSGILLLTIGLRAWSEDYNRLIKTLDNRVIQFRERSQRDALTGLYNRGEFESYIGFLIESRCPFSLLLADLDNFKTINDKYGHPMGDRVLRTVARTFKANLTDQERAFRVGGEEFAVVSLDSTTEEAQEKALFYLRLIRNTEFYAVKEEKTVSVTFSGGVATSNSQEDTVESLYGQADAALYRAKDSGRNQVCHL